MSDSSWERSGRIIVYLTSTTVVLMWILFLAACEVTIYSRFRGFS